MPFFLLALAISVGYLDYLGTANLKAAGSLVYDEMFGSNDPFYKWLGALLIVGALGYVQSMEPIADGLLILILVGIILSNKSGFAQLIQDL